MLKRHWSGATAAATALLDQQHQRQAFTGLSSSIAPGDVSQAYAAQDAFVTLQTEQRATGVSGYKIAITTPVMQAFVGFNDAISGCVLTDSVFQSGHALYANRYQHLIIEFELALEFGQDLPERTTPWTADSILEYIHCAYPSLEIADDRHAVYADLKKHFFTLVAENAWNHGVVLGPRIDKSDFEQLWLTTGTAFVNGQALGAGKSHDVMGHPLKAMAWIANHFQHRGRRFKAGEWVTTGSWLASYFPQPGQQLRFEMAGLSAVSVQIN